MNRRDFLAASALPLISGVAPGLLSRAHAQPAPFDRSIVRQMARDLAGKPYKAPDEKLPDNLADIDYDHYRAIRFLPERALWRGEKLAFEAQFFHRGFFYKNRVDIFEVKNGQARTDRLSARAVFIRRYRPAGPGGGSRLCRLSASCADQQARLL